jgi:hypothetical protein
MPILIIRAELVNPPSLPLSFRDITLFSTIQYNMDVCVEVDSDVKDIYYHWMKPKGLMDFVQDIIEYGDEIGIRVDTKRRTYHTIVTDRLVPENVWSILYNIKSKI